MHAFVLACMRAYVRPDLSESLLLFYAWISKLFNTVFVLEEE